MKHWNKNFAAFVLAAITVINLFPNVSAEGTVTIATVNDFRSFAEKCVYDGYSKDKTFVLQSDIDLKNEEIAAAEVFCGRFEGGGHTIKNVKIKTDGSAKGLFGTLSRDAQIHNLNVAGQIEVTEKKDSDTPSVLKRKASEILKNGDIEAENLDASSKAVGGIAGYNEGKIVNCTFSGKISGKNQVGGIVGANALSGIVDNSVNEASVSGDSEIGGIVGYNEGRIKLSKNKGTVCRETTENTVKAGGICGNNKGALVICTNDGTVGAEGFGDNIGGICGIESGEIRECINNGTVTGRRSVGGICGRFEPYTDIDLSYESAKEAVRQQAETLKNDINTAKGKISDYASELLGVGDAGSLFGLSRIGDSAVNMMDSIAGAFTNAAENNTTASLRDALDKGSDNLSELTDETVSALREAQDSLDSLSSEFDGKGKEITDLLDNLNDAIDKGEGDVDEIRDSLTTRLNDLEDDINDVTDKLDETHTELNRTIRQLRYAAGDVAGLAENIDKIVVKTSKDLKQLSESLNRMSKLIEDFIKNINPTLPTIRPILPTSRPILPTDEPTENGYEADPDGEIDTGYDVTIGAVIKDFLVTTAYAEEEKTLLSDLSTTEISLPRLIGGENADTALVRYCVNNGEIKGSEMAGGIAGCMGFESAVRNGQNVTLDGKSVNTNSVLKALVDSCVSTGKVTAKSAYAGGVCGKSDLGNIKNTLTTGEIEAGDGGYAGGTAGLSGGEILNCIAINDIDGKDHIGGIAGSGKDIKNSYALPRLDGKKEKSGAIAGFVSGEAAGCYFIDEGLSGIDGANFAGKAEPVVPNDMVSSDGVIPAALSGLGDTDFYMASDDVYLPQIRAIAQNSAQNIGAVLQSKSAELSRFHFNVVFKNKDEEVRAMTVEYGTVLTDSDIPKLDADGGEVPVWDKDTKSPIIRHTTFNAEYNRATTTISSGGEPPVLLVEGVFDEGTEVSMRSEDITHKFSGYKNGEAYSFTLSRDAYGTVKVHIRDEKKKAAKIGVQNGGQWEIVDCEIDGSYAVFEMREPGQFVILYKHTSPLILIGTVFSALLAVVLALTAIRRIKNGKNKKENI